jgi:glycosyltransferase involved in cell wall biosynthesis
MRSAKRRKRKVTAMKVSVLMLAYNQEPFIREALDSVLAQRTSFDFEIVMGEDCSTDGTRAIIESYESAHPGRFRVFYRRPNVGMIENLIQTYRACRGDYIAVLESDDYWVNPLKLQKQIDFFDRHPDFSICFHDTFSRTNSADLSTMPRLCNPAQKEVSHFFELFAENFIQTCSVMWRNLGSDVRFPDGLQRLRAADWPLHLMHAQHGPIGYIPEAMAVYRVSPTGMWSRLDIETRLRAIIDLYRVVDNYFDKKYTRYIQYFINHLELELAYRCTSAEALRLQPKEKQLVEALAENGHLQHDLNVHKQAMQHLLASRGVRIGQKLSRLAGLPRRLMRALKSPLNIR